MSIGSRHSGFNLLIILVIVIIIGLIGLVGWRFFSSTMKQDGNSTGQSTTPDVQENNEPENVQADPNEGFVVIKEWGVRFKPVEGLQNLEYFRPSDIEGDVFSFTTTDLAQSASACSPESRRVVLGLITRSLEQKPVYGGLLAKIGEYYYQYRSPQAACSDNHELEIQIIPKLSASLDSLEPAL